VRFSPDGQSIITASDDQTARIWRTSDGKSLRTLPHGAGVADGLFSPDGQWIATRSDMVRIWDAATGSKRVEIAGPRDPLSGEPDHVFALIFSDNGKCLITLSDNALTADVWETSTGEKLATLTGHTAPIRGASFSPNGRLIVTASLDETAQLYPCDSCGSVDDLLSAARKRAGRELTPQERLSYQIPADKP
jgi:WD40 repeat protein